MKKLGFGCARLPLMNPNNQAGIDMEQFCRMVDLFLEQGFTYFDTAYMYHGYKSEIALKKALTERYPRERYLLATKLPLSFIQSVQDQGRIFGEQLKKCGVGYFDVYLLHAVMQDTYQRAVKMDSFRFLSDLKEKGKVRHIGLSYHDNAELLDEILTLHPEVEYVQLQINYLDWEDDVVQSRKCYEAARRHGCKIIVMEPVKGGNLANIPKDAENLFKSCNPGMSVASWAVRYAAGLDGVEIVLSGMSNEMQVKDNINYMGNFRPLGKKEHSAIKEATEIIKKDVVIPCTSCHYCTVGCPKKIPIPEYFSLYNTFRRSHGTAEVKNIDIVSEKIVYDHYFVQNGKASECIGCLQCEKTCPQHLPVTKWLRAVADCMEDSPDRVLEEGMKRKQEAILFENARCRKKYDLLCQWMKLRLSHISLVEFFEDRGIQSVAVYGAGELGVFLCMELLQKQGLVKYILDSNAGGLPPEKIGVPIFSLSSPQIYGTGAVIITPVLATDEIEDMILKRFPGQTVYELEEVLYGVCKKHGMSSEMWGV